MRSEAKLQSFFAAWRLLLRTQGQLGVELNARHLLRLKHLLYPSLRPTGALSPSCELELELIQSHMAQKPVLRGEVGCACVAREVSVESEARWKLLIMPSQVKIYSPGVHRAVRGRAVLPG